VLVCKALCPGLLCIQVCIVLQIRAMFVWVGVGVLVFVHKALCPGLLCIHACIVLQIRATSSCKKCAEGAMH